MRSYYTGYGMTDRPTPKDILGAICGAILIIALSVLVSSCKVQSPVVLPEQHDSIRTETADRSHYERDSIYVHDSVYVLIKGDTIHEHHWHTEYKEKAVADTIHDSIYTSVHDSVPYPVPGPTEYIRQRNGYDRFTSWGFWLLLAGIAIGFVGKKKGWWRIVWGVLKRVF